MYHRGKGVERNLAEATRLYKQAALLGSKQAAQELLELAGKDLLKADLPKLKLKAKAGEPEALFLLATLLESGHGVKRNPTKALRLLQQAADAGWTAAQFVLAREHLEASDLEGAVRLYRAAADKGYAPAQVRLAVLLSEGKAAAPGEGLSTKSLLSESVKNRQAATNSSASSSASAASSASSSSSSCSNPACQAADLLTKLLLCGRCRKAQYCSQTCQKLHWKTHKQECAS